MEQHTVTLTVTVSRLKLLYVTITYGTVKLTYGVISVSSRICHQELLRLQPKSIHSRVTMQ